MNAWREQREALGISQSELAKIAGVSRITLRKVEGGQESDCTPTTIAKIERALGLYGNRPAAKILAGFRDRVQQRMEDEGISQVQLAALLKLSGWNCDQATISRIFNGIREPKLSEAVLLAAALKLDLSPLVAGVQCPTCQGAPPAGFICATCGREGTS